MGGVVECRDGDGEAKVLCLGERRVRVEGIRLGGKWSD